MAGLSYAQLGIAYDNGLLLQRHFAHINTDDPDLRRFRAAGGKMLMYHGLADVLIMPQGSIHYYNSVVREMGSLRAVQRFYRFFLIPGMTHGLGNGTTNADRQPAAASQRRQRHAAALRRADELGRERRGADANRHRLGGDPTFPVAKSRPICLYPTKAKFIGGDINVASSYACTD